MNKADLVNRLAQRSDLSKKDARMVVDSLFDPQNGIIAQALRRGDRVGITGFGTFDVRQRAARMGRNPRTGQPMRVPASRAPAFRPGKGLREGVSR